LIGSTDSMDAVWPDTAVEENNPTVQISALRRVLDQGRTDGDSRFGDSGCYAASANCRGR
jgi:hypothetical protein